MVILLIYVINLIRDAVILQFIIGILLIYAVIIVINAIILIFNIVSEVLICNNPVKINKQGIKMSDSIQNSPSLSLLSCNALVRAIGCLKRWNMLKILSAGEPMGASELGKLVGCNVSTACKHMQILAAAGLVEQGRGRLYRIPPRFQPTPGKPVIDYGHCLIRFDHESPAS
ncbi:MAG: winged helix-turn-helix domain-containing protein [Verrucomicrobiota bacterium]